MLHQRLGQIKDITGQDDEINLVGATVFLDNDLSDDEIAEINSVVDPQRIETEKYNTRAVIYL